jgi:hypothetical protein
MAILRLRYEKGHFVPLDEIKDIQEGMEIRVEWQPPSDPAAIDAMLERTAGLWADLDNIEELINDSRAKWDDEWQQRLSSL